MADSLLMIPLSDLLLDGKNPRFGGIEEGTGQTTVLDHIVKKFGIDDVISSIAVNGYIAAEPLVVRPAIEGAYEIAEGNRRLAACLILASDKRARNQTTLGIRYRNIWKKHGSLSIDPLAAVEFSGANKKDLLSYLGVRHISGALPWDSYAKAAWVAQILRDSDITVAEVSEMIGDQHKTVRRLLEGYYFMGQLVSKGLYDPSSSLRRGRGSVTEYPFSWVYTILGHRAARNFVGFDDGEARESPIPDGKIDEAMLLVTSMFGDARSGHNAAISESRQLGALANVFVDREKVGLLRSGKSVLEIEAVTQPIGDRLEQGLLETRNILQLLVTGLTEESLEADVAGEYVSSAGRCRSLATEVERKLKEAAGAET